MNSPPVRARRPPALHLRVGRGVVALRRPSGKAITLAGLHSGIARDPSASLSLTSRGDRAASSAKIAACTGGHRSRIGTLSAMTGTISEPSGDCVSICWESVARATADPDRHRSAARRDPARRATTSTPMILEREKERVFGRTWQLVARADELQRVGDFVPVTVLDEPIVITHAQDGQLRVLQRVPPSGRPGGAHEGQPQVAPVPLPRLDLRARRLPACRAGDGGHRGLPQGGLRPDPRARGPMGPLRLRQPLDDAPPLREVMGAIPAEVARPATTSTACGSSSGATT
jgi:hypothetical protein